MDQRGQATPLVALVVLAAGGLMFGMARFGADASHAAQAQAAADAAALAGAAEGRGAAAELAAANGAELLAYEEVGRDVEVRTRVGDTWAVARARRTGGGDGPAGWVGEHSVGGAAGRLDPSLRAALARAAAALHQPVPIIAASGRAVAVPRSFAARLEAVSGRAGLCRLPSQVDPVRFRVCLDRPT